MFSRNAKSNNKCTMMDASKLLHSLFVLLLNAVFLKDISSYMYI